MAKEYIEIQKGMVFEQRFISGRFKGRLCARGGIDMSDTRWGDWDDERTPKGSRPRNHVRVRGSVALEVRATGGKSEGQILLRGNTTTDGHRFGLWEKFYPDGKLEWRHQYAFRGQKHGHFLGFFPNGQKHYDRYFDNDKPFGMCEVYFDNAQIRHKGLYDLAGIKEGEWVEYDRNGRVLWHVLYENSKKKKIMQDPDGPADYKVNNVPLTSLDDFLKNATFASKREESEYKKWLASVGLTPTI